jgi:hypothetical protein
MLELVDGVIATGEKAFRPGRVSDPQDSECPIDPTLLAGGTGEGQRESSPGAASERDETSEKVGACYCCRAASVLTCTYHRMILTTQPLRVQKKRRQNANVPRHPIPLVPTRQLAVVRLVEMACLQLQHHWKA